MLDKKFQQLILKSTDASSIQDMLTIQELWSGYGHIYKIFLDGSERKSVIVKHIAFPDKTHHPRGWDTEFSHKRKIKSYKVEINWYQNWAKHCSSNCYVPQCLGLKQQENEILIILEDLDLSGFPVRKTSVTWAEMLSCINWLAHFHAVFMGKEPDGLWKVGTYWHLDTRPDELKALKDHKLKSIAGLMDQKLKNVKYKSFVHGDAKLANFCFSEERLEVAAVDFQYVGSGCGMKDLVYLVGSCIYEDECENLEADILNAYFLELKNALNQYNKDMDSVEVEREWRSLYHIAWTDFHRFIKGWSPDHWKINSYSEKIAKKVIEELKGG